MILKEKDSLNQRLNSKQTLNCTGICKRRASPTVTMKSIPRVARNIYQADLGGPWLRRNFGGVGGRGVGDHTSLNKPCQVLIMAPYPPPPYPPKGPQHATESWANTPETGKLLDLPKSQKLCGNIPEDILGS